MEDDLNIWQMKDDFNIVANGGQNHFFLMEDNLNILANGRRPQYFAKWKIT